MKKRYLAAGAAGLGAIGALVAWKFLTRAGEINWDDFRDRVHHPENSHFAEIDGATIHYQEFGDASHPTLILIHGYTASTYVWQTSAPMLAENNFHVISVDLIGFGYSDKPKWFDYSIASQARMISRLMNRLGIGRATVVGSSYGGAVASTLALDYPERVEKLVLVDAVCNDDVKNHPLLRLAAIPVVGEVLTPFLIDSKFFLKHRMKNTLAPENHHLITKDRIDSVHRPLNAANAHHSVLATSRSWEACRIEADAQYIDQPTLIIWGDKDTVISIKNGEKLYDSILNSRFVVFENCGHVPQEENPELFVDLVTEFTKNSKGRIEKVE
jgi:pimeloyl-ACP methyl ester carboxylesterase